MLAKNLRAARLFRIGAVFLRSSRASSLLQEKHQKWYFTNKLAVS
jgi:hypothetical protein